MADEVHYPIYRVADLLVDTGQARVTRSGSDIPLPRLSFELLVALVRSAPRVATTDELLEKVWRGVVVSPETLNQRVSLLRAALGDDPKQPRYIAGVRARGYKLVAPVTLERTDPTPDERSAAPAPASDSQPPPARNKALPVLLATSVLAMLGIVLFLAQRSNAPPLSPLPERSVAVLPFDGLGAQPNTDTLAQGIAEAVIHQLATVRELTVVSRASSFAFRGKNADAREVGRKLGARYLLGGSVQYDGRRMRVTAQLVDSQSGHQMWSVRIERTPQDIFAVQDEIALHVTRALKLSLDASATDKLTGQGTANFDAYLSYLQGRAHAATLRLPDTKLAIGAFEHAVRMDPAFAAAYVELAAAKLLLAEFDASEGQRENFETALDEGKALVERALQLDPMNGHAYVERANIKAFTDLAGAEADFRRGIALSPSYSTAYAGLASVLNENPERAKETLEALDRAHQLDPLEPRHDVTKAVFLFYRRSDTRGANDLLTGVLERDPLYQPALMRLAELRWHASRFADAVRYGEQALTLDPLSEWTRRLLIRLYVDLQEPELAGNVAATAPRVLPVRMLPVYLYRRDWAHAAEITFAADEDETLLALDEPLVSAALRMYARTSGEYDRAIALLERVADVSWDDEGQPRLPKRLGVLEAAAGLADTLVESGERDKGLRLARTLIADIDRVSKDLQRGASWYAHERALALSILGDREGALRALEAVLANRPAGSNWWFTLESEPLFRPLHDDPRYRQLLAGVHAHVRSERAGLQRLRAEGLVTRAAN